MKNILRVALAVSVVGVMALPANAGVTRTETFEYKGPTQAWLAEDYGIWIGGCMGGCTAGDGSPVYMPAKGEKKVQIHIKDSSGTPVRGAMDQPGKPYMEFCGKSPKYPIVPGKKITIYISANPCGATPDGVPTQGTVTTKFFN